MRVKRLYTIAYRRRNDVGATVITTSLEAYNVGNAKRELYKKIGYNYVVLKTMLAKDASEFNIDSCIELKDKICSFANAWTELVSIQW